MANDDENDGYHSGHTVVLGAPDPEAAKKEAAKAPGALNPSGWGAKTMALPAEAFDGIDFGGEAAPGASAQQSGKTMSLPVSAPPSSSPGGGGFGGAQPGGGPPAGGGFGGVPPAGGGFGGVPPAGGGFGGAQPGGAQPGGGDGGGGIPYLETQAISVPTGPSPAPAQQYPAPPPQHHAPPPMSSGAPPDAPAPRGGGGGFAADEPVKTTLLDPSKIDLSAIGGFGSPAPAPPPQQPQGAPPGFDSAGMAQGQKTVILRPDEAMAALEQQHPQPQQAAPPHLQGKLVIFVPETEPIVFELMPGITTVGRGMENHLVLGDPYASRKHLLLTNKAGQYMFEDAGSDNGTQLNGRRTDTKLLETGDVIEIGSVMMRFVMGPVQPEHQVRPGPMTRGKTKKVRRRKKKKKNQTQLIIAMVLVVATIGLIVVMALLYLQRQS